jgi:hypothetical protein
LLKFNKYFSLKKLERGKVLTGSHDRRRFQQVLIVNDKVLRMLILNQRQIEQQICVRQLRDIQMIGVVLQAVGIENLGVGFVAWTHSVPTGSCDTGLGRGRHTDFRLHQVVVKLKTQLN